MVVLVLRLTMFVVSFGCWFYLLPVYGVLGYVGLLVWFILDCCGLRLVVGCGIVSRWRASVVVGVGCGREFLFGV